MVTHLSTDSEAFIPRLIAKGAYRDRTQVLEAGLELLRRREELLARIDEGRRQLDEGEIVDFDQAGLIEFFKDLKLRAREVSQNA